MITEPPGERMTEELMSGKSIKQTLRTIASRFPGSEALISNYTNFVDRRRLAKIGDSKQIFTHYYEARKWGNDETVSGSGSTLRYTENIRRKIPQIAEELGIDVLLDAPCGDHHWFRMIEWAREITYIGGDIVESLVDRNRALYGSQNKTFIELDIVQDSLLKADLWLCRDCWFHLSNRDIMSAIDNFLRSEIRYLLTSTHPDCDCNTDIPTGSARLLNLELPPFNFPSPIRVIDDWIEGFPVRYLALWEQEDLRRHLA